MGDAGANGLQYSNSADDNSNMHTDLCCAKSHIESTESSKRSHWKKPPIGELLRLQGTHRLRGFC